MLLIDRGQGDARIHIDEDFALHRSVDAVGEFLEPVMQSLPEREARLNRRRNVNGAQAGDVFLVTREIALSYNVHNSTISRLST